MQVFWLEHPVRLERWGRWPRFQVSVLEPIRPPVTLKPFPSMWAAFKGPSRQGLQRPV